MPARELKAGSKIEALYNYVKREMVGAELQLQSADIRRAQVEVGMKMDRQVWDSLHNLEKYGLLKRRHSKEKGGGIFVSFPSESEQIEIQNKKNSKSRAKKSKTVVQTSKVNEVVHVETRTLDQIIADLTKDVQDLDNMRAAKMKILTQTTELRDLLKDK